MKLKAIKVYQPILFNKRQETFFSTELKHMQGYEFELTKQNLVSIKLDNEHIYVTLANIQYMVPISSSVDTAKEPRLEQKGRLSDV